MTRLTGGCVVLGMFLAEELCVWSCSLNRCVWFNDTRFMTFFSTGDAFNDPLTKTSYQSYCVCMRLSLMSAYDVMQAFKTLNIHCFQIASNSCIYAAGYWCVCVCVCVC